MKRILLLTTVLFSLQLLGQDNTVQNMRAESSRSIKKDDKDTSQKTWKTGGIYSLNIAQGSLSNWAAGGDNFSLSVNSLLSLFAFHKHERHSWDNTFDFNLGYIRTTSLGSRKNDDRFDLLSKYGYAIKPNLNISGLFNIRSQFFKGYTYPDDVKTFSSDFMAPGYVLLSAGFDYKATKHLSIFVSPATARWVIVRDTALSNRGLYGVEPGHSSAFEFGAFATINYMKDLNKIISYKGRLDLFSNYRHKPTNIDVFMSNVLNVKLSKVLSATWGVDLIYDDDVRLFGKEGKSPALQVKSLVGIGLLVKFNNK